MSFFTRTFRCLHWRPPVNRCKQAIFNFTRITAEALPKKMSLQIRAIVPVLQPRPQYRSNGSLCGENWAAFVVTLPDFSMSNLGGLFRALIIPRFSRTSLNGGSKNEREEKSQTVITPNYTLMIAQEQPQELPFRTVYQGENKLCCVLSQLQNASRTSNKTAAAI